MELHGKNIIAGTAADASSGHFTSRGELGVFEEANSENVDLALQASEKAFHVLRKLPAERRAAFLDRVALEIEELGDSLLTAANLETALPVAERLLGERARTCNQIRMFASLVREGSWVDACIDRAVPDRKPVPKPDVRRMLLPLGPVAVFSASNFPLAFSVAGGDTASALAAGCPVVVKAHPAHPATSELSARAIVQAAKATDMPPGIFSMLHSTRNELALSLVQHPITQAVAFTGSLHAGRALFNAAAQRPNPIPVYAEMGSINPVFVLPGALRERAESIAQGLKASVLLGGGQFCTCPGFTVGIAGSPLDRFVSTLESEFGVTKPVTLLYRRIADSYAAGTDRLSNAGGVRVIRSAGTEDRSNSEGRPALFLTNVDGLRRHPELTDELFGPSTVLVRCNTYDEMLQVAGNLEGQLTATIHGTTEDLLEYAPLVEILQNKVGRLIFNSYPTGVEVCAAMQHGGPYPATTDSRTTSVGSAAILRFARPVAYQNFPDVALPPELQNGNPRGIWRKVDGELSRGSN